MVHTHRCPVAAKMLARIRICLRTQATWKRLLLENVFAVYSAWWRDLVSAAKPGRWEAIMGTIAEDLLQEGEARGRV